MGTSEADAPTEVDRAVHHLLVIDDDDSIREVAQLALELIGGWTVSSAASGHDGWQTARDEQPDAILLDVMMPDMDGPSTYAQLNSDPATSSIPVIFLTAKHQAGDPGIGAAKPAGVIAKPFDPMTLAATVASLLGWDA